MKISGSSEELEKQRVKVINGLETQLQKQAREAAEHSGCTCKKSTAAQ